MNGLATLASIDPVVAEAAMRYRWPTKSAKVALSLMALDLFQMGLERSEISAAMGVPPRMVSAMLQETASVTSEVGSIGKEFRVIPYRYLMVLLLAYGDPMRIKRGQPPATFDFSTIDKIRAFFSASPPVPAPSGFPRDGADVVRKALGIQKPALGAYKASHSATTIKAAIAVVERSLGDPLVQTAVARWCSIL